MAATQVKHSFGGKGLDQEFGSIIFGLTDVTGTITTRFTRLLHYSISPLGTAAQGTTSADYPVLLIGTAEFGGTNTGTAGGISVTGGTVAFNRPTLGTVGNVQGFTYILYGQV